MSEPVATAEVLTPRGRGAVATVLVCGDCGLLDQNSLFRAANGFVLQEQYLGRIVFGRWGNEPSEEVVLCRTSESRLEIHCHGGEAAVMRILSDLKAAGCGTRDWEASARRREKSLEAECAEALSHASTLRAAAILLDQQAGALQRAVEQLQKSLTDDESGVAAARELDALLQWAEFGVHLVQPWRVVLAGRPNVGKSSLINAIVGFSRSVVHDLPGTTRDVVTAETALAGWPVQFSDTAGLRDEAEAIEAEGIALSKTHFAAADCRILVFDRRRPLDNQDRQLLKSWPEAMVVANKCDLPDAWSDKLSVDVITVSAVKAEGIDRLVEAIVRQLVPAIPPSGNSGAVHVAAGGIIARRSPIFE